MSHLLAVLLTRLAPNPVVTNAGEIVTNSGEPVTHSG